METKQKCKIILGVTESDSHVVANHLIAHMLRSAGIDVVNLGACTSVREFADAAEEHRNAKAILIGSLNGHALEDLRDLNAMKTLGKIRCPVILGGNLSVGANKSESTMAKLFEAGVDRILGSFDQILSELKNLGIQIENPVAA